jgi:hypothetical protein
MAFGTDVSVIQAHICVARIREPLGLIWAFDTSLGG